MSSSHRSVSDDFASLVLSFGESVVHVRPTKNGVSAFRMQRFYPSTLIKMLPLQKSLLIHWVPEISHSRFCGTVQYRKTRNLNRPSEQAKIHTITLIQWRTFCFIWAWFNHTKDNQRHIHWYDSYMSFSGVSMLFVYKYIAFQKFPFPQQESSRLYTNCILTGELIEIFFLSKKKTKNHSFLTTWPSFSLFVYQY